MKEKAQFASSSAGSKGRCSRSIVSRFRVLPTMESSMFKNITYVPHLGSVQEILAGILVLTVKFSMIVCPTVPALAQTPSQSARSTSASVAIPATSVSSTDPLTIPASFATGIALVSAVIYQVATDSKWKDFEDLAILAAMNGVVKLAANSGQTATTADYNNIANQIRSWLDPKAPQNQTFDDEAAVLRYTIDALVPLVNGNPVSPLLAPVLGGLENTKLTQLLPAIDTSRQYPANLAFPTVSAHAFQFIADTAQEASDLAHNDPQYAAAVNPVLSDLLGTDRTCKV
jgi:hypothetical protein